FTDDFRACLPVLNLRSQSANSESINATKVIHLGVKKRALGWLFGLVATVLRVWAVVRGLSHKEPESRTVLIVEPFGMGDMISHQPLIQTLCQKKYDVRVCARREWR